MSRRPPAVRRRRDWQMATQGDKAARQRKRPRRRSAEGAPDSPLPLLDLSDAAVKKMIKAAKKRGYVTYDQLNAVLPSEEVTSEQIEDICAMLNEMGINVVETEEAERRRRGARARSRRGGRRERAASWSRSTPKSPAKAETKEPTERTDDPVRMYLREMGSVELLSREGEIAIAKRIEAGREAMIAGLCESPLTFQAIIIWRDELNEGKVFLRDIIDLEATYAGPDAKAMPAPVHRPRRPADAAGRGTPCRRAAPAGRAAAGAAVGARRRDAVQAAPADAGDGEEAEEPASAAGEGDFDDDDMENSLSLAAIEAELKPKVVETFDTIADAYKRLRRLQDQDIQFQLKNDVALAGAGAQVQEAQGRDHRRGEVAAAQPGAHRRAGRAALRHQQAPGRLRGPPDAARRELRRRRARTSSSNYQGSELDPRWLNRVSKLSAKGWKNLVAKDKDRIKEIRGEIHELAGETGARDRRVPQDRAHGAEGRARGAPGQEGDGGGEPAPRHLDRQEIHQPRPAVPRPDPGRQHRPDEGGRQVRVPPRLQVLDLRHLVDPPGDHPLDRRPGAHHPHPGAHDRDDQQDRAHQPPDAQRDRPRADAGGARREARHAAREGAQGPQDRQGAALARDADRRRGGFATSAISSRTRTRSCRSTRRSSRTCARPRRACWPRSRRARSACCACASASA